MTALEVISSSRLLGCIWLPRIFSVLLEFLPVLGSKQKTFDERAECFAESEGVVQLRSVSWCLVGSKVAEVAAMQTRAVSSSFSNLKACGLCPESCGIRTFTTFSNYMFALRGMGRSPLQVDGC